MPTSSYDLVATRQHAADGRIRRHHATALLRLLEREAHTADVELTPLCHCIRARPREQALLFVDSHLSVPISIRPKADVQTCL